MEVVGRARMSVALGDSFGGYGVVLFVAPGCSLRRFRWIWCSFGFSFAGLGTWGEKERQTILVSTLAPNNTEFIEGIMGHEHSILEYKSTSKMRLAHITTSPPNPSHFTILVRSIPYSLEESYSNS
ncbi:unnamed protein product, partial [Dovyalis caffra]